jgi:AcrR family transcriptional regulator
MNQDDLAREANLSKRTIYNYEHGREPEGALGTPDGYYDVARVLGWTPESVDVILAGGDPTLTDETRVPDASVIEALIGPIFRTADLARDAGAPEELVVQFRNAAFNLLSWLNAQHDKGAGRILGEGVEGEDAERILAHIEADTTDH